MAQFIILLLLLLGIASLIGQLGKNRRIGFGWSFALSFFLSPIIGLIITLCSKKNDIDFVDIKKED